MEQNKMTIADPTTLADIMSTDATICAISTPPGTGGIAVARISGPEVFDVVDKIWRGKPLGSQPSHTAHLGRLIDPADGSDLDSAVATVFRAPNSFTGQDTVELSVHGSPYIQHRLLQILTDSGATLAAPGQFTRRAFTSGKLDLAQAEAVADVIAATTPAAHRLATSQLRGNFSRRIEALRERLLNLASLLELELDFTDQDVEFASRAELRSIAAEIHEQLTALADTFRTGDAIRRGVPLAIVGHTNAGKSTLLNTLLSHQRAIVSSIPGTTRDTIEENMNIGGTAFRLIDTAGLRETTDPIEAIGIDRSRQAIAEAIITLWIVDSTDSSVLSATASEILGSLPRESRLIIALNKTDLPASPSMRQDLSEVISSYVEHCRVDEIADCHRVVEISAATGRGIPELKQAILDAAAEANLLNDEASEAVTNVRHYRALRESADSACEVIRGIDADIPPEFIAQHLRATIHSLSSITGAITTPEILSSIFSRFCVGK